MPKAKAPKLPPSKRLLKQFSRGKWIPMLAEAYGASDCLIESLLMSAVAKLLAKSNK